MDVLISKQALMKKFAYFVRRSNNSDFAQIPTWNDAVSLVESMPPIPQWIPCSERVPIRPDSYFVTGKMKYSFEKEWEYFTDVAWNYGKEIDNFWDTCNDWDEGQEIHIIAWTPLPDPWKGR